MLDHKAKVRGLTLSSQMVKRDINLDTMLEMIKNLQCGKVSKRIVNQFRIKIDGKSKELKASIVKSIYASNSNKKRFFLPSASKTATFAYGVTKYEV